MTYIRGIWLFGNSVKGNLELIQSRRYKTVEKRVKELLGEDSYADIPDDNQILSWFVNEVLFDNVSAFPSNNVPLLFKSNTVRGVFSVSNIQTDEHGQINKEELSNISHKRLLSYMYIKNGKGKDLRIWPFMHSFRNGFFILVLLSLETSILTDSKFLDFYKSFCGDFSSQKIKLSYGNITFETIKLIEVRIALQLLEDLLELISSNQKGELIDADNILKIWRIMIPFGSPILDNKEVEDALDISSNTGIPKRLARLFERNNDKLEKVIPIFKDDIQDTLKKKEDDDYKENTENFLFGDICLDSVDQILKEVEIDSELEVSDFSTSVPVTKDNNILLDVFNYGIERLLTNKKGSDCINNSDTDYSVKFSLIEVISCFAKKHPLYTEVTNYRNSFVDNCSVDRFMSEISEPYSSFISGVFEFSGKLPSSVSISCNILLPWQKLNMENELESSEDRFSVGMSTSNTGKDDSINYLKPNSSLDNIKTTTNDKYKYIQPYILVKDNISCTKVSDEYFDIVQKTYRRRNNEDILKCKENKSEVLVSRYKLTWKSNQVNSSEILSYWYPYEKEMPVKGYFTLVPETQEPINQVAGSKSKENFRPILIHDFRIEYCLCLDPKIVRGMEICQITTPLIPGILKHERNRQVIPSIVIFNHNLKASKGTITVSPDKKSINWIIDSPKELLGMKKSKKNSSKPVSTFSDQTHNSFIQIRMNGTVRIRLIYKEKSKARNKNKRKLMVCDGKNVKKSFNSFDEPLISPVLESYPIHVPIEAGTPHFHNNETSVYDNNEKSLYSAPNPFATGIQSLLNHPIKDIDPIWLLELHPKIGKYSDINISLSKKEAYEQLTDLMFPYSLVSFVANLSSNNEDSTYRGVQVPKNTININPKALKFVGPEIYTNSGKYIIWRNS